MVNYSNREAMLKLFNAHYDEEDTRDVVTARIQTVLRKARKEEESPEILSLLEDIWVAETLLWDNGEGIRARRIRRLRLLLIKNIEGR
ncbi:MAG: hypothetical protein GF375_04990 [Candidatus Omnitrophica bacterium]|nr:hypothetical protein [Candidatus Omnitrophota bacterium]